MLREIENIVNKYDEDFKEMKAKPNIGSFNKDAPNADYEEAKKNLKKKNKMKY